MMLIAGAGIGLLVRSRNRAYLREQQLLRQSQLRDLADEQYQVSAKVVARVFEELDGHQTQLDMEGGPFRKPGDIGWWCTTKITEEEKTIVAIIVYSKLKDQRANKILIEVQDATGNDGMVQALKDAYDARNWSHQVVVPEASPS